MNQKNMSDFVDGRQDRIVLERVLLIGRGMLLALIGVNFIWLVEVVVVLVITISLDSLVTTSKQIF